MKQIVRILMLVGLGLTGGTVLAAPGYVDDIGKSIVRTGYGDCLHTGRWSKENYIKEYVENAIKPSRISNGTRNGLNASLASAIPLITLKRK